jgi:hypothetical protein
MGQQKSEKDAVAAPEQALRISALEPHTPVQRFFDEKAILERVPVSRRTWWLWKSKGLIPYIRIGRRVLYDWPSVREALLRMQRTQ